jgi:hypothetical protein
MSQSSKKKQDPPKTENEVAAYRRFQRLQEHSRSNIPAMLAQRATSTFTLHNEPAPAEATDQILVVVYPQDPFVGEPEVRTMSATDIGPGLANSRVRVHTDDGKTAQPDSDGNYLFWPGSPEFDQVNSFYYTTFTLRMYERYARRALPWSFPTPRITVHPQAGNNANAFYSEQERLLGFHSFELNGKTVSTAQSADIVSHETGHAILDGLRDLYNESFGLAPNAFHEAFGDITAMLVAMHDDSLIRHLLDWTKGNLRTTNFVAEVAEQLTDVLISSNDIPYLRGHTIYLRNAINELQNMPFDALPYTAANPVTELSREGHNYSRLFTGVFYDIFAGIYDQMKADIPAHIAIYRARDIAAYLLVCSIESGPVGEFGFGDMAKAFLASDLTLYDGQHQKILIEAFDKRKILDAGEAQEFVETTRALPAITLPETINSALAAALFLEEKIAPALKLSTDTELVPLMAYKNATGYAFLSYFSSQEVTLEGDQFGHINGAKIDLFGGLTLMFGADGRLRSVMHRPIVAEDIRQIKSLTADLIRDERIVENLELRLSQGILPEGLLINSELSEDSSAQDNRLIRYPVKFDPIPNEVTDFVEYLHKIEQKSASKTKKK